MIVRIIILFAFLIIVTPLFSQQSKKTIQISKVDNAPKIDGKLDDSVWQNAPFAKDFVQFVP